MERNSGVYSRVILGKSSAIDDTALIFCMVDGGPELYILTNFEVSVSVSLSVVA